MIVQAINIKTNECGTGYYLRWYADGWHYWLFKGGFETYLTSGEIYKSIGYSSLLIGDVVKITELAAIRGILRANFIELYTNDGWKPATLDNESWQLGKADRLSVAISFTITAWLKGDAQIVSVDTGLNIPVSPVKNGRLYNWYAVNIANFLPTDLAIPTSTELQTLSTYLGGDAVSGGKLKEIGTTHWNSPNTGASNSSGFTCLGSGYRTNAGLFADIKVTSEIWSKTEYSSSQAYNQVIFYDGAYSFIGFSDKKRGCSVRPIYKGSGSPSTIIDYDGNLYNTIVIGSQRWLAQNWKCTHLNDGTVISEITDPTIWATGGSAYYCNYNNDPLNA